MEHNSPDRKSWSSRLLTACIVVSLLFSSYSLFKVITLQPGEKVTIVPGVTVEKPEKRFDTAFYDDTGNLILKYTDGSVVNAGKYTDSDVENESPTPVPTVEDLSPTVAAAVAAVCANGACKGDTPTRDEILAIVQQFCSAENQPCKGAKGDTGPAITSEQIYAGWVAYCTANDCKGPIGDTGATGPSGRTPVFSCVIRWDTQLPSITRYWFAQKYEGEPDTAYVNKYRLGSEQASNNTGTTCVDLRT